MATTPVSQITLAHWCCRRPAVSGRALRHGSHFICFCNLRRCPRSPHLSDCRFHLHTKLSSEESHTIVKKWVKYYSAQRKKIAQPEPLPVETETADDAELLSMIQKLSPAGFEHLCRRLLLEYGFKNVTVTQRTRDGGIDGEGILEINPFISSVVVFQCKKYTRTVSSEEVTRLRGAAGGRADKAILITTGTFSAPAKSEAIRISPHIELINGEQLVAMFEEKQLGVVPRTVFDLDHSFFQQFPQG